MRELKGLLVEQLHDLLNAENQTVGALPKIVEAAHNAKLKELFGNHLTQTEKQVKRLELSLKTLGETTDSKPGKATKRLLEEGQQTIEDGEDRGRFDARSSIDRCAESATYEISGYGAARCLAKQIGEREVAILLTHTLGSASYIAGAESR